LQEKSEQYLLNICNINRLNEKWGNFAFPGQKTLDFSGSLAFRIPGDGFSFPSLPTSRLFG